MNGEHGMQHITQEIEEKEKLKEKKIKRAVKVRKASGTDGIPMEACKYVELEKAYGGS